MSDTSESTSTAFVAIDVPKPLANAWPAQRGGGDDSPPHFTLLFVGDVTKQELRTLNNVAADLAPKLRPFVLELEPGVSWFTSRDTTLTAREIAHKKPTARSAAILADWHASLRTEVERAFGRAVAHHSGDFLAHSTLRYQTERHYAGNVPEGLWIAGALTVRGADNAFHAVHNVGLLPW